MTRHQGKWIGIGLVLVGLLALRCSRTMTTYASLAPENQYVGKEACQSCHQEIYQSYVETGMGKSLYRPELTNQIESFGAEAIVYDADRDLYYQPYWLKDAMYVKEYRLDKADTSYRRIEKIDYVVGSGHQTRSYLIERKGYLYEVPITWYVNKQIWDLSPGYAGNNSRFDREIGLSCLACHTGTVDYVPHSKNRYRFISEGIDCEKCHGPGQAHIKAIQGGQLIDVGVEIDYTIVNPAKLPIQQQFDVCQQCHLQGENVFHGVESLAEFRPAMDLHQVADIFVEVPADPDAFGIASHAQRLQQSACFLQSEGKLTCTTCHNPHKSVAKTDPQVFVKQCQACHQTGQQPLCAAPPEAQQSMQGNCISCHMPYRGTSDIPHVSFHDHYIRVMNPRDSVDVAALYEFVDLYPATNPDTDPVNKGLAWLQYYEGHEPKPAYLEKATGLLSNAPLDVQARLAFYQGNLDKAEQAISQVLQTASKPEWQFLLGDIQEQQGKYRVANQTFSQLYHTYPDMWEAGLKASTTLLKAEQGNAQILPQVMKQLQALKKQKPTDIRVWSNMGFVALNQGNLPAAESYLVRALALNPDHAQSLENMVFLQLLKGNGILAEKYLMHLKGKHPAYPAIERLEATLAKVGA